MDRCVPLAARCGVDDLVYQNQSRTPNQKMTVHAALRARHLYMIQGPPGTGKTTAIKEIVYQYLTKRPNAKVLIVAQQNVAVDNALEGIYRANETTWFGVEATFRRSMIRCRREEKIECRLIQENTVEQWFSRYRERVISANTKGTDRASLRQEWIQTIDKEDLAQVEPEIVQILLKMHQIVGATCVGLAGKRIGLDLLKFDLALVDEAGRATHPELLIPMLRSKKVILIGDHYQLPPTVKLDEDDAAELGVDRLFMEDALFKRMFERSGAPRSVLTEQFRMPDAIGTLISTVFYADVLPPLTNGGWKPRDDSFIFDHELLWYDIVGKARPASPGTTSLFNQAEVDAVRKLLTSIADECSRKQLKISVAVITPYAAQKFRLRAALTGWHSTHVEHRIDTIDAFQGKEADIIIYSAVRNSRPLRFLLDRRRLNVAISRTRENLVIVGNRTFLTDPRNGCDDGEQRNYFSEIGRFCRPMA